MGDLLRCFLLLWVYRYVRLIVNCVSSWSYGPLPLPTNPSFFPRDVTIIIPTIGIAGDADGFRQCVLKCVASSPKRVFVVTVDKDRALVAQVCRSIDPAIRVLSIDHANKRHQICHALPYVRTQITVLVDDDVRWPPSFLPYVLAPFEDASVGAVGTTQRVLRRKNLGLVECIWQYLGACYIERRNFEISATTHIDGGISCLSGRSAAIRTSILKQPGFVSGYKDESWFGVPLKPDDDNFITRYLVANNWRICIQMAPQAQLLTTLEINHKFLFQCLRWARSNWRSNLTSLLWERHVWRTQPWCIYALYFAMFSHSLIHDPLLFFLLYRGIEDPSYRFWGCLVFGIWLLITKFVKLLPHYLRYPTDLRFFPVTILFGYFHGLIKLYALLTLSESTWGSRDEITNEKAT